MTASPTSSSGLEVLFSTLQNTDDVETTLNNLSILDELLSAGSDRRVHYMISRGGSEALLRALVHAGSSQTPNYNVLLPLLHLLAKVGRRDDRIGLKAEEAGAVLLTLALLKRNIKRARRAAACLLVIQVFAKSASAANLIGVNQGLDLIYHLIPRYSTKHTHTIKASINAFAALLRTKANVHSVVSKGYVSGLLRLYEDWHGEDAQHGAMEIRLALLRCLHRIARRSAGRRALQSHGGLALLYRTTQACLKAKCLELLVEASVQLMRRCAPPTVLPLRSEHSAYCFPLPRRPCAVSDRDLPAAESDEESDEEEEEEEEESVNREEADDKDYDDDLETDLNKLRLCPSPDRPKERLLQYSRLCPELSHDFQELDLSSEPEESSPSSSSSSSDEDAAELSGLSRRSFGSGRALSLDLSASRSETETTAKKLTPDQNKPAGVHLEPRDFHGHGGVLSTNADFRTARVEAGPGQKIDEREEDKEGQETSRRDAMIDRLLEKHGACIPNHEPKLYRAAAARVQSVPGFNILAFPDFWGHLPPPGHEPMAPREPHIQRQKVLEDIRRFVDADDIINQVVFDLEDSSLQCPPDCPDSLRFFSKFESGNLRKVLRVRRYEYDLILNADVNCSQHFQWFYFEISGVVADVPYRFNIINCEKSNSQFNYGMQPVLYSVREALDGRPHWVRTGSEICYYRNHFYPAGGRSKTTFYTLTFTVTFKHNEDVCYLAYHYPYTFSALKAHLNVLNASVDHTKVFFRQQILSASLAGNSTPLVTITACPASRGWKDMHQLRNRPYIVLTCRVHPGESNASWVMKGTLEFLCSADPLAQSLREAFIFKIIPMLNPDGVINGTNRCDLNGEDLNRQWCKPDPVLCPTIYHAKGFLYYLTSIGRAPLVFCDYHGHSRKKNVFLYGCSVKETLWQSGSAVDTVGLKEDPGYRTLAKTLDRLAPAFSFNSCNYLVEKSRSATARVVVWREMGVLRSYTMESTYNGCNQGIYNGLQTGTRELQEMGVKFCQSLLSVTKDARAFSSQKLISSINLDHNSLDHKSHTCFEDDEPPCAEEIEFVADCPVLKSADLDSDVDINMAGVDEEEDVNEGLKGGGRRRSGANHLPPSGVLRDSP